MDVLWADAELESLSLDYDAARLLVRETTGRVVTVVGAGVIGVELLALWDEAIVEHGEVLVNDPFDRDCYERVLKRLGPNAPDTGSTARNTRYFSTLRVAFIDGSVLQLAAAEFSTRTELSAIAGA